MLSMFMFFFRKRAVVAELKDGSLPSPRIRDFLLFTLLFTTILRLITAVVGAMSGARESVTGMLIAGVVVVLVLVLVYFVIRQMLLGLYKANGGEQGRHFLERLVALGISAMVRITPFCIVVGILIGISFSFLPAETWVASLMGVGPLALMIGVFIWTYYDIKNGLIELSAS